MTVSTWQDDTDMSENYSHLLIPKSPTYRPKAADLAVFFQTAIDAGIVGKSPDELHFQAIRWVKPKTLRGKNPATGEPLIFRLPPYEGVHPIALKSPEDIPAKTRNRKDFNVWISGNCPQRLAPVPVGAIEKGRWKPWKHRLALRLACCVRSKLVSMSNTPNNIVSMGNTQDNDDVPRFRHPCKRTNRVGYFTDPITMNVIEVPDAGCASFWIELEFGKWLVPRAVEKNVSLARPDFIRLASNAFQVEFRQGCFWG
jgi:hypothetical protein